MQWLTRHVRFQILCYQLNLQSAFHKVETGSPQYYQYTMSCRLGRNSITKTGRFLTPLSFNVLPVKSSFAARHLLTVHKISWIRAGGIYLSWHHISMYLTVQR